jgi:ankyrin repeat protein
LYIGADIDAVDDKGQSPLFIACSSDASFASQCREMLLELGAKFKYTVKTDSFALSRAIGRLNSMKIIQSHDVNLQMERMSLFVAAAQKGNVKIIRNLLATGFDINAPHMSIRSRAGHYGTASEAYPLMEAANVSTNHNSFRRAVELSPDNLKTVALLLESGAKVDLPLNKSKTLVIHYLVKSLSIPSLDVFIDHGFDPNIKDQLGQSVFLAACQDNLVDSHKQLHGEDCEDIPRCIYLADSKLGAQIDYLAVDNEGKNMLMYLAPKWNKRYADRFLNIPGMKDLVYQKDNKGFSCLQSVVSSGDVNIILQFINDCNPNLLEVDPNGNTIIHLCSPIGPPDDKEDSYLPLHAKYLAAGGQVDTRNADGYTPLLCYLGVSRHENSKFTHKDRVYLDFFLSNGANPLCVTGQGETALHIVAKRGSARDKLTSDEQLMEADVFQKFMHLGCDPLQEDSQGFTALDIAAARGKDKILALFQRKKE